MAHCPHNELKEAHMPNHCRNTLVMSAATLPVIIDNYIGKDERGETIFDFERVIPIGNVPDWHEQRLAQWGTKWVGYEAQIGESCIDFYTAWSPPIPILRKLAELHKDLAFRLEYYELGDNFRGAATARWNGEEVLLEDDCWDMTGKDLEELGFSPKPATPLDATDAGGHFSGGTTNKDEAAGWRQEEIRRLRAVIRENREKLNIATAISYQSLYELWTDLDDAEAPDEVSRIIEHSGLGPVDAVSFNAFCYGYCQAMRKIKGCI
jgi:hypothetical protein